MNIEEFRAIAKRPINADDYILLQHVYMFHPSINETDGKKQIAALWDLSPAIVWDMYPRATQAQKLEDAIRKAQAEADELRRKLEELRTKYPDAD